MRSPGVWEQQRVHGACMVCAWRVHGVSVHGVSVCQCMVWGLGVAYTSQCNYQHPTSNPTHPLEYPCLRRIMTHPLKQHPSRACGRTFGHGCGSELPSLCPRALRCEVKTQAIRQHRQLRCELMVTDAAVSIALCSCFDTRLQGVRLPPAATVKLPRLSVYCSICSHTRLRRASTTVHKASKPPRSAHARHRSIARALSSARAWG